VFFGVGRGSLRSKGRVSARAVARPLQAERQALQHRLNTSLKLIGPDRVYVKIRRCVDEMSICLRVFPMVDFGGSAIMVTLNSQLDIFGFRMYRVDDSWNAV
jgi:hypothetical protein